MIHDVEIDGKMVSLDLPDDATPDEIDSIINEQFAAPTPAPSMPTDKAGRLAMAQQKYDAGQVKPEPVGAALAPRTAALPAKGASPVRAALSGAADAASFVGRAAASLPAIMPGGETYGEALGRTKGKPGTGPAGFVGSVARDPALIPSMAVGGPVARGVGGMLGAGAKSLLGRGAIGAATSVAPAAIHQAENVAEGKPISGGQAAAEVALGGAVPLALGAVAGAAKKLSAGAYGFLKRVGAGLTGVSEDALETASTKAGRETLKGAAGTEGKIAGELLDAIDNIDDYIPEANKVAKVVDELPPISTDRVKAVLQESVKQNAGTPSAQSANKQIGKLIAYLDENPNLSAKDFRDLRVQYDTEAAAAFNKDYKTYLERAILKAREVMAKDLVATAEQTGKPEYAEAMKSYAQKLQAVDRIKAALGGSSETRARRVESFIDNLFGKNKTYQKKIVGDIQEIFGGDILTDAKMAQQASEFGTSGTPGWLPTQTTGRSLLGSVGGPVAATGGAMATGNPALLAAAIPPAMLSSPKAMTGAVLPGARGIAAAADATAAARVPAGLKGAASTALTNVVQPKKKRNLLEDSVALRRR